MRTAKFCVVSARAATALSLSLLSSPVLAQETQDATDDSGNIVSDIIGGKSDYNIMIGVGPRTKPSYPGADENKILPLPVINAWRDSERFPVSTPDESFGIALIGKRGKTSFGPTLSFATQRKGDDAIEGLSDVGFGMEAGAFGETYLGKYFRIRGELRQGLGGHKGLTGDLAADAVFRTANDKFTGTLGPRLRWGNGKYNRAFFGVNEEDAAATGLDYYRPKSGIYAYGAMAGAYYQLSDRWGLFGYAGYDRLQGDAADSPIVRDIGSRDQYSAGIAATYTFKIKRK